MIVGCGYLGERVKGRNGNVQRADSGGRSQICASLLFSVRREVVAAKQPERDVREQQWPKGYFGSVDAARVGRYHGVVGHDRGVEVGVIG